MGIRFIAMFAVLAAAIPVATAHDMRPKVVSRVHDAGICWDPDIEYPIACDDDDDD